MFSSLSLSLSLSLLSGKLQAQIRATSTDLLKVGSSVGSSENIGIGTNALSAHKLYVTAAPSGSAVTRVLNSSTSASVSSIALEGVHNTGVAIAGSSTSGWAGYFTGKMYVSNRIGIGTTTPNYRLELQNTGSTGASRNIMLRLTNGWNSTGSNMPTIQFHNGDVMGGSNEYYWNVGAAVASSLKFAISYKSPALSSETEFFTISHEGKVSIGGATTASNDYRLFVQKGIATGKVFVSSTWADYVFAPGYDLMPLPEVAAYIGTEGHLPGIPSAAEVETAGGVELSDMTLRQMEKIEELYLHVIALNERIEALEAENTRLKSKKNP
ncbi:MAG: hypothetical protein SF053_03700 [Bacteroidia bacterium]|nr:hypothetical protein [Bacteroidia bacterium]